MAKSLSISERHRKKHTTKLKSKDRVNECDNIWTQEVDMENCREGGVCLSLSHFVITKRDSDSDSDANATEVIVPLCN